MEVNKSIKISLNLVIELGVTLLLLIIWWLVHDGVIELSNQTDGLNIIIDAVVVYGIITIFCWKSGNRRYFVIALVYILLAMLSSLLEATTLTYYVSTLAYVYLIFGFVNQLFFRSSESLNER